MGRGKVKVDCARLKLIDNCCVFGGDGELGMENNEQKEEKKTATTWSDASHNSTYSVLTTTMCLCSQYAYVRLHWCYLFFSATSWRASIISDAVESSRQWKLFSSAAFCSLLFHFPWRRWRLSRIIATICCMSTEKKSFTLAWRSAEIEIFSSPSNYRMRMSMRNYTRMNQRKSSRETTRIFFIITREICVLLSVFFFDESEKSEKYTALIFHRSDARGFDPVLLVCGDDDDQRAMLCVFFSCVSHRHHDILARNDIYKIT